MIRDRGDSGNGLLPLRSNNEGGATGLTLGGGLGTVNTCWMTFWIIDVYKPSLVVGIQLNHLW